MEQICVGIDVAKDRLDVHIRPSGETFTVPRDHDGLSALADRLQTLTPALVVMEATGGFEVTVAAALSAARCRQSAPDQGLRSSHWPARQDRRPGCCRDRPLR